MREDMMNKITVGELVSHKTRGKARHVVIGFRQHRGYRVAVFCCGSGWAEHWLTGDDEKLAVCQRCWKVLDRMEGKL
jgi:hypothetical protein